MMGIDKDNSVRPALGLVFLVMGLWFVVTLCGCDSQKKMVDPKGELEKVAEQYWTKRFVDRDYKFTYNLELDKESIPFSEYVEKVKRSQKLRISSVKTKEVRIDGDRGEVYLTVMTNLPAVSKEVGVTLQDLWLLRENEWKHKFTAK